MIADEVFEIECNNCGSEGGVKELLKELLYTWGDIYGDGCDRIRCPMCGNITEVIPLEGEE
tara:strand:+ start:462 stop:644 length:183 start_codon:yes stop_codon:yes gene_type:complete